MSVLRSKTRIARAARFGQGWLGFGMTPEMTKGMFSMLDAALADAQVQASLEGLRAVGFWLEPSVGPRLVRALVGMEGVERMRALTS